MRKLVVIPSDPIEAYEKAGYSSWLQEYYNPEGYFDEVYALSPLEVGVEKKYGMTIIGVAEKNYRAKIKEIKPDVVRAYGGYWPCDLACNNKINGIPVIVSVHDTKKELLFASIKKADHVICMAEAVKQLVLEAGVKGEKIDILPNRIDSAVFHSKKDHEKTLEIKSRFRDKKIILHVGRKSEQKNIDTLIKSLVFLPDEFIVVFVGLGDAKPYKKLSVDQGVEARCFWIDTIQNNDLPYWYSACDCMCTPSRWEGFGIVFIEAAACGAVVVTSDISPMNEYFQDRKNAILVKDYENPKEIANSIRIAVIENSLREFISREAIDLTRKFSKENIDALEVSIYERIIKGRKRSFFDFFKF